MHALPSADTYEAGPVNDHRPRFVCLLCMPSFCCLRWRCFVRCVSGLRPDSERNIAPARRCVVCSMAFVKEKPPLLAEIGSKSVVLGEHGRFIFHAGRRNPKQGRYFFQSIPIAMRHGGHERRVSASASFPWPKQVVAMKMKRSVSETAAGGATQVAQLRLLKPTARKKSPCCECLRRKRDIFRPACRKWREMGDFCGVWRVLYRLGWTGVCAGRVLSRLGWTACVPGEFCTGWGGRRVCRASFVPVRTDQHACRVSFVPDGARKGPLGKCCEAKVVGLIAARYCRIGPGGGAPQSQPLPCADVLTPGR